MKHQSLSFWKTTAIWAIKVWVEYWFLAEIDWWILKLNIGKNISISISKSEMTFISFIRWHLQLQSVFFAAIPRMVINLGKDICFCGSALGETHFKKPHHWRMWFPCHPCMVYSITYIWLISMANVGTINLPYMDGKWWLSFVPTSVASLI